ncbi:MAG: phosphodiester glycosidase family protein, partial [Anaerolineales bacterium]|nr:phosphodiester glycosidase family protein [Anaerolineales bacterium]
TRQVRQEPRALVLHVVELDLTAVSLLVTPPPTSNGRTTTDFLREFGLQLAINGSFYQIDRRSDSDDLIPLGQTIANGVAYAPSRQNWPVLCIRKGSAAIYDEQCPVGTEQGLAGNVRLVTNSEPVNLNGLRFPGRAMSQRWEARTAVGLDRTGSKMWLLVVDGRQPGYSEGVTLPELADLLHEFGVYEAINLDGGGSSTLAAAGWLQPTTLNAPAALRLFPLQRPVATHLGVYAQPLE